MKRLAEWLFDKPNGGQGDLLAALDIGTSKVACFIASLDEMGQPHVIGIGHQLSEGVRAGLVADMEAVRRAVSSAVEAAEQMAGEKIERVVVNVAAPQLLSQTVGVSLPLGGREITAGDMDRMVAQAQTAATEDADGHAMDLLHAMPVHYALDGQRGVREPQGMVGSLLQADYHLVSAAFGPMRTLETVVARSHLDVERLVAAPLACGLSCLVEDEMDLGCVVIDIGAGTTGLGIFFDGHMIFADGIPLGGLHISNDIARGLTTTFAHAERMKTLYGNALPSPTDDREIIDVPQIGEDSPGEANHLPKSHLIRIIGPRLEEIFELVRARLAKSGMADMAGRRVVLTGGTSQLPGIRDLAGRVLDKQVRLGRPLRIARPYQGPRSAPPTLTGLAEATSGPAFATTAGLLVSALQPEGFDPQSPWEPSGGGFAARFSQWIKG